MKSIVPPAPHSPAPTPTPTSGRPLFARRVACTLFVAASFLGLVACATPKAKQTEGTLSAAGFRVVNATTPAQQEKLRALKPDQITRISRTNQIWYVYPATRQNELFVGSAKEYQIYQQLLQGQQIAAEYTRAAQQSQAAVDVAEDANFQAGMDPWVVWPAWEWPVWTP